MGKVWLLMEDGSSYAVTCRTYDLGDNNSKQVDGYIVTEQCGSFNRAARRAAHGVYHWAIKNGKRIGRLNATFDLAGPQSNGAVFSGESGGVGLAIAFGATLWNKQLPNIAATGVITPEGDIEDVEGIKPKIEKAATLLSKGDYLFLPKKNLPDLPKEILDLLNQKSIKCHPVSDLSEILTILFPSPKIVTSLKRIFLPLLVLMLAAILGMFILNWFPQAAQFFNTPPSLTETSKQPKTVGEHPPEQKKPTVSWKSLNQTQRPSPNK